MSKSILKVPGIGKSTAKNLANHGIRSAHDLAATSIEKLTEVEGFGTIRAAQIIQAAKDSLDVDVTDSAIPAANGSLDIDVTNSEKALQNKSVNTGNEKKEKKKKKKKEKKKKEKKTKTKDSKKKSNKKQSKSKSVKSKKSSSKKKKK